MFAKLMTRENKIFARLLLTLSLPIMIQNLLNSALNLLDVFMLGRLGEVSIAAAGLGNQVFFLFTLLTFGINSGATIFMSQYWGREDVESIHRTMGICFTFSMTGALLFAGAAFFIPEKILFIYSKDAAVIALGAKYLRIVAASYLFSSVTQSFIFACRSIGKTVFPMMISLFSLCCNGLFNAVFIFGLFGVPAMGVQGAALGTLLSRFLEMLVAVTLVYYKRLPIATNPKNYFTFRGPAVKNFLGTAGFVMINEMLWGLGTSLYNSGYRFAGTDAQAAVQIAMNMKDLFMVISFGVGAASAVILGNRLGAGEIEQAKSYAKKFTKVVLIFGLFMSIVILLVTPLILQCFNVTPQVRTYARYILLGLAIMFPFKCITHLNIVGILRSGGDTLACMLMDLGCVWLIGLPMSFIGTLVLKLPIYWVTLLVFMEEPVKAVISQWRVRTGKWIRKVEV